MVVQVTSTGRVQRIEEGNLTEKLHKGPQSSAHLATQHSHPKGLVLLKVTFTGKFHTKMLLFSLVPLWAVCVMPSDTPYRSPGRQQQLDKTGRAHCIPPAVLMGHNRL